MTQATSFSGLGIVSTTEKNLWKGEEYIMFFPGSSLNNKTEELLDLGTVFDTIILMARVIKLSLADTKELAPTLKGVSLAETCRKIWDFAYNHHKYKLDNAGVEELRTPRRSWEDRRTGIDCDDFSILVSSILTNLNIPHKLRMAKYNGKSYFQHIYVVVPKSGKGSNMDYRGDYFTVDPVVDRFDYEVKFSDKHDKDMMPIQMLSGIDNSEINGGISNQFAGLLAGQERKMTFGNEFSGIGSFEGLGNVIVTDEMVAVDFLFRLKQNIINTVKEVQANPKLMAEPDKFITRYTWLLQNFDDPQKREIALDYIEKIENLEQGLSGLGGFGSWIKKSVKTVTSAVGSAAKAVGTGVSNATQWTGKTVVTAAKAAGEGIKNAVVFAVDKIKEFNPLFVTMRLAFRGLLAVNMFKMAERLGWGYLTESEARAKGLNITEFAKAKSGLDKAISTWGKFGGDEDSFKKAVLLGWKKGTKNGTETGEGKKISTLKGFQGLGVVPVAGAATAAPITAVIAGILKFIPFDKLFATFTGIKNDTSYPDDNLSEDQYKQVLTQVEANPAGYNENVSYKENVEQGNVAGNSNMNIPFIAGGALLVVLAIKMRKK